MKRMFWEGMAYTNLGATIVLLFFAVWLSVLSATGVGPDYPLFGWAFFPYAFIALYSAIKADEKREAKP